MYSFYYCFLKYFTVNFTCSCVMLHVSCNVVKRKRKKVKRNCVGYKMNDLRVLWPMTLNIIVHEHLCVFHFEIFRGKQWTDGIKLKEVTFSRTNSWTKTILRKWTAVVKRNVAALNSVLSIKRFLERVNNEVMLMGDVALIGPLRGSTSRSVPPRSCDASFVLFAGTQDIGDQRRETVGRSF